MIAELRPFITIEMLGKRKEKDIKIVVNNRPNREVKKIGCIFFSLKDVCGGQNSLRAEMHAGSLFRVLG